MKRFAFRLERVLQLRLAAEQEQARTLGQAVQLEQQRREATAACAAALEAAMAQAASMTRGLSAAGTLANLQLSMEAARARLEQAEQAQAEASAWRAAEQERYEAAMQARKALEKLREQQFAAWSAAVGRIEQATIDEIALRQSAQGETG